MFRLDRLPLLSLVLVIGASACSGTGSNAPSDTGGSTSTSGSGGSVSGTTTSGTSATGTGSSTGGATTGATTGQTNGNTGNTATSASSTTGGGSGGSTGGAATTGTTGDAGANAASTGTGGGTTTSTGGSGTTGASTGGSDGGTTSSAAVFSDDFESGSLDMSKWVKRINSSSTAFIMVDNTKPHKGQYSLHVNGDNGFSTLLAHEGAPVFPAPNNNYFARVWIFVPKLPSGAHVIWLESGDVTNDTHEVRIGMNLNAFQANLIPSDIDIRAPDAPMTANTWHCIEYQMGNDLLNVWLDGTKIDKLSTTNWVADIGADGNQTPKSNWSPMYAAFRLGWELAGAEVWYDDVALGFSKIGCQ